MAKVTYQTTPESVRTLALQGAALGLVAGLIFACGEILTAQMMGLSALEPVEMFASVALGRVAMTGAYSLGTILIVGAIVNYVLAASFGAIYGALGRYRAADTQSGLAREAGHGMLYGLVIWGINFYIVAPALFPWFLEAPPLTQALLHATCYGLPLGVLFAAATRRLGWPSVYPQSSELRPGRIPPRVRPRRPL